MVVLGAYVRLTAAGLGCPDWPGCYGQLTPGGAAAQRATRRPQYAGRPLEVGKAWREMIHRYAVGTLSCLILALAVLAVRARRAAPGERAAARWRCWRRCIVQALLGMLTVTWRLNPLIVTLHLLFGMTTLALLWWLIAVAADQLLGRERPARPGPRHQRRRRARRCASAYRLTLLGLCALARADRARRLDQQQLRRRRLPGFPDLPGHLVAARATIAHAFVLWHGLGINYEGGVLENPARVAIHLTHRLGALLAATALTLAALFVLRRSGSPRRGRAPGRCWPPSRCSWSSGSRWCSRASRCGWRPRTPRARRCCCWRRWRCCAP